MRLSIRIWTHKAAIALAVSALVLSSPLFAQQAPAASRGHRKLAVGVVTPVDPAQRLSETFSRHDLLGIVDIDNDFNWAKGLSFRHDVWSLEFKFKPMRMIPVDIPQKSGKMRRKLIWYLVYSVTNTGKTLHPEKVGDDHYTVKTVQTDIRFVPEFLLVSHETNQVFQDRVIPIAIAKIRLREDPQRRFYNSAEMIRTIKVGETVWGVATWEDVDRKIDRFSVYIKGLTNAYRWTDDQAAYKKGGALSGRHVKVKTLKLNFWRPGDEFYEHEGEFRFGIPGQKRAYEWVYIQ